MLNELVVAFVIGSDAFAAKIEAAIAAAPGLSDETIAEQRQRLDGFDEQIERILLTPFHNMALMSPATTAEDVDAHTASFGEAAAELSQA